MILCARCFGTGDRGQAARRRLGLALLDVRLARLRSRLRRGCSPRAGRPRLPPRAVTGPLARRPQPVPRPRRPPLPPPPARTRHQLPPLPQRSHRRPRQRAREHPVRRPPSPHRRHRRGDLVITNLTPHPIRIYGWDVPDRFNLGDHEPYRVIEPSGAVARIGEIDLSTTSLPGCDAPVSMIEYRHANGLPPKRTVPWDRNTDWYVVSLALALSFSGDQPWHRNDLLVPYREVRNLEGTVIGCRTLALPV